MSSNCVLSLPGGLVAKLSPIVSLYGQCILHSAFPFVYLVHVQSVIEVLAELALSLGRMTCPVLHVLEKRLLIQLLVLCGNRGVDKV